MPVPYVEYDEVEAICSDCGRIFRSEESLAAHREDSHSGREEVARNPMRVARAVCPHCARPFDSPTTLRAHTARAHPRA